MKKALLTLVLACAAVTASAQSEIFDSGNNKIYFGARLSLDITCPTSVSAKNIHTSYDVFNPGAGLNFGGVANIPVYANLYFEPGVMFYYHTAKVKDDFLLAEDLTGEDSFESLSLREFGMQVPLMIGYHFDFNPVKVLIFTGPEFSVGFSGKSHYTSHVNGIKMSGSESMYDDFNRGDVAWRFGAGVNYDAYHFSVSAARSLTNWTKADGLSLHRTNVSITLGYNFSL